MGLLVFLVPLTALILAACSFTTPQESSKTSDSSRWYQHQKEVRHFSQYQTHGACAYLSDKQKVYVRFFWQETDKKNYRLLLLSSLGNTELELIVNPDKTKIIDSKGKYYIATNPEEMISKLTGIPIPLNNLHQWILGLPGEATDYKLDDDYRIREINYSQNGKTWKITYTGYDTKIAPAMPSSIELAEDGCRIKLKMDNWTLK